MIDTGQVKFKAIKIIHMNGLIVSNYISSCIRPLIQTFYFNPCNFLGGHPLLLGFDPNL